MAYNTADEQFFAFISYDRKDKELAQFIQDKMEDAPCPEDTAPEYRPKKPDSVGPVFVDRTDMSAKPIGFEREIIDYLKRSRFLIVICSPYSAQVKENKPYGYDNYVNWEIAEFLKSHDNNRGLILPVIYDDAIDKDTRDTRPINEYFPSIITPYFAEFQKRNIPDFRPDTKELEKDQPDRKQWWESEAYTTIAGLLNQDKSKVYDRYIAKQKAIQKQITDQRDRAEGLLNFFIYDLRDEINKYIPIETRKRIQEKITQYQEAGDDDRQNHDRAAHLANIGDLALVQGNTQEAMDAYQESLKITKRLSEKDTQNDVWQRDLTVSLDRIGDLYKQQGKTSEAEQAYNESLAVMRRLSEKDTQNDDWQRDLTVSLNNIGDLYKQQGKTSEAEQAYKESLAVMRRLSEKDTQNDVWQRDLTVSLDRIGDLYIQQGKTAEAEQAYNESLAVRRRLSEKDPQNVDWQTDLVVSLFRLHTKANLTEALQILLRLKQQGILPPDKEEWISIIEEILKQ